MKNLLIASLLTLSTPAFPTCEYQLAACNKYVDGLVTENSLLQSKIAILTKQRDEANEGYLEATRDPLLPAPAWFVLGLATGAFITILAK